MDYKKKYEQALERAKYLKENTDSVGAKDINNSFEYIFPELKETEDERIRKNCIHFLDLQKSHHASTFEIDECIAWLEKQGERYSWSVEDEYQINTILHGLDLKRVIYKKEGNKVEEERYYKQYNWLKSLKAKCEGL